MKYKMLLILVLITTSLYISFRIHRYTKTRRVIKSVIEGAYWQKKYSEFNTQSFTEGKVIFLGNSLTDYFPTEWFEQGEVINRGICGDITEGVILRLHQIIILKPTKIFIEIGINDIIEKVPLEEITENYDKILFSLKNKLPSTQIFILNNLPI